MTDEQQETIVNEALRIFCKYLNHWWDSEEINKDEPSPYTPENFTTWDPERSLWGETNWEVLKDIDEELAFPEGLLYISTSDGDEGGGSTLWVGLQGQFNDPKDISISWITHTFDLSTYMIYTDGQYRTSPNGELKKI
jgi:hypothetical protein